MGRKILQRQTRINTRNNRLLVDTNGTSCCCPETRALVFRGCCDANDTLWLLTTLVSNPQITNISFRGKCFYRTEVTALVTDLDASDTEWFGSIPDDMLLLNGRCVSLRESGFCPECPPTPPADCCFFTTRQPCRLNADFTPTLPQDARCCVHGSGHSIEKIERFNFVEWGYTGQTRIDDFCSPRFFDIFAPIYQIDQIRTIRGRTSGECGSGGGFGYLGTTDFVQTGSYYTDDGSEIIGDDIVPINPRRVDMNTSWSLDRIENHPTAIHIGGIDFGLYPMSYLYLRERETPPGFAPGYSICDGEQVWEIDSNNDGVNEQETRARVVGNIQCQGGQIVYTEDGFTEHCVKSDGSRLRRYYRLRQSLYYRYYNIDDDRCPIIECNIDPLGRNGPSNNIINTIDQTKPRIDLSCIPCRQQPGL